MRQYKVRTVMENRTNFKVYGKSGKIRENQIAFSVVWEDLCSPDKIKEFLFLLNICETATNDYT